ncbi:molybdopterin converting factor subunit 1 [Alcanivorax sp.]|uniref:molybdopterin converting factor subunit 1 n=1 Tax=Alcanivorax sp. TaxID=1872427 RepID=UPI0025C0E9FE|nr:molybdopterin converting factor subunit 1 [Alcanivorax sp.]
MIEIRFFAALRERVGSGSLTVTPPDGVDTVAALVAWLVDDNAPVAGALEATPRYMVAVNEVLSQEQAAVRDGDVVALFPPVTGG